MTRWIRYAFTVLVFKAFLESHTFVTFVAPEEGLFRKPKYRAIFCFIHFLLYVFRLLCLRFFNCRKDQSFRIFFYFKCFTDPGLLKIRQLSTPCRCGLSSL